MDKRLKKPINEKKLQEKIGWKPHEGQKQVLKSNTNETTINAGRRWGKSALMGYISLKMLLKPNQRVWIAAPTYDLAKKPFDYVVRWLGKALPSATKSIKLRPNPRIELAWESWLECKSAENPKSFLGEEVDTLIIEEAAQFSYQVFENYLFPVVSSRGAKIYYISTPCGRNWFYKKHLELKQDPKGDYFHFESRDNPYFSKEEWERAKKKLSTDFFNQNYRAAFLEDGAAVFSNVRKCIGECLGDYEIDHFYIVAADIAKHKDWTVIIVMDKFSGKVRYFERFQKQPYPEVKRRIVQAARKYRTTDVVIDSTGVGDPIGDWLRYDSLNVTDFKFGNASKAQLVEKMKIFFDSRKVIIPNMEVLIDELQVFSQDLTPSGKLKYEAPQGNHDDCVDALGLAIWRMPTIGSQVNPVRREDIIKKRKRKYQFK